MSPAASWSLQVLGPVRMFRIDHGPVELHLGSKSRAVLAWLACRPGHTGSRGALLDLLWSDSSTDQARVAMRQCLFQLRTALDPRCPIRATRESIQLDDGSLAVDLDRFLALASSASLADLVAACTMYRGDLAEDLNAPAEFRGWLSAERRKIRHAAVRVLERCASELTGVADAAVVEQLAYSLLSIDPLHEGCWRTLMTVHARCGLLAEAEAAWQECRRVLRTQVGVEPSSETRRTHESLSLFQTRSSPVLIPGRTLAPSLHTDDAAAAAHDHYLRGWQHYFNGSAADNALARRAYAAAAALEPRRSDFAVLAAWTHFTDFQFGWNASPARSMQRVTGLSRELRRRFPTDPLPQALQAKLRLWHGEFVEALEGFESVRRALPESAILCGNHADALLRSGQPAQALRVVEQAMTLDPDDRGYFLFLSGMIRFALRDLDGARASFEAALRRNDGYCLGHGGLAAVLSELGRFEDAREAASRSRVWKIAPGLRHALHVLGPHADGELVMRWKRAWLKAGPF